MLDKMVTIFINSSLLMYRFTPFLVRFSILSDFKLQYYFVIIIIIIVISLVSIFLSFILRLVETINFVLCNSLGS